MLAAGIAVSATGCKAKLLGLGGSDALLVRTPGAGLPLGSADLGGYSFIGTCGPGQTRVELTYNGTLLGYGECTGDGSFITPPIDLSPLPEGPVIIIGIGLDPGGNPVGDPEQIPMTIDRTPPTLTVVSTGAYAGSGGFSYINADNVRAFAVSGTCSEPGLNVRVLLNSFTKSTLVCGASGTFAGTIDFGAPTDGTAVLSFRQTDLAGNEGSATVPSLVTDITPPVFNNMITFSPTQSISYGYGCADAHMPCAFRAAVDQVSGNRDFGATAWTSVPPLSQSSGDGTYYFHFEARDGAGNIARTTRSTVLDNTAPLITSRSPTNAATSVSLAAAVSAVFNEALDPADVTGANFTVSTGGVAAAGTVTYDSATRSVIFTPTASYAANTVYTAELTTGLRDVAHNALASTSTWTFTTAAASDVTAPAVTAVSPVDGTHVDVTFSEALDESAGAFNPLTGLSNYVLSGTGKGSLGANPTAIAPHGGAYRLTFAGEMKQGGDLIVTVANVRDLAGNVIGASNSGTAAGAATGTAPTVASFAPASGTVSAVPTTITISFSESMRGTAISNPGNWAIACNGLADYAVSSVSLSNLTARVSLNANTPAGAGEVCVFTARSTLTDLAGNALTGARTATYTVAGTSAFNVVFSPGTSYQSGIPGTITATFTHPYDPATMPVTIAGSWAINCVGGGTYQPMVSLTNATTATITLFEMAPAPNGAVCTLVAGTTIKDTDGNSLTGTRTAIFTKDSTVPTVAAITPTNGTSGYSTSFPNLSITFSEQMDPATINTSTVTLKQGATPVAGSLSLSGNYVVFRPLSTLAGGTAYTLAVSTGAKDPAGNALASAASSTFTTASAAPVELWRPTSLSGMPTAGTGSQAVWTGSEVLVWGGNADHTGSRYDPVANNWTAMATLNAPSSRTGFVSAWTGTQMLVWGGDTQGWPDSVGPSTNTGGRYDPLLNQWSAMNVANAPSARIWFTGAWTGSRLIVYGGTPNSTVIAGTGDGGVYDPSANSWAALPLTGAGGNAANVPLAVDNPVSVWTGSKFIVWGGYIYLNGLTNAGFSYDPVTKEWTALATQGAPAALMEYARAVWTGTEMIVVGCSSPQYAANQACNNGARYRVSNDTWYSLPTIPGTGTAQKSFSAVWTGSRMLVWNLNLGNQSALNNTLAGQGFGYDPTEDAWIPMPTVDAPAKRIGHAAVWAGDRMIVWGGTTSTGLTLTGGVYKPVSIIDTFSRADSGIASAESGQYWEPLYGYPKVMNQHSDCGGGPCGVVIDGRSPNGILKAKLAADGGTPQQSLLFRFKDEHNYYSLTYSYGDLTLEAVENDVATPVWTDAAVIGDAIKVILQDDRVRVYVNSTPKLDFAQSAYFSAGYVSGTLYGMEMKDGAGFDDFSFVP